MMLADLGFEVIKVERPGAGDETRGWGPPFNTDHLSAYYLSINRNKLSITLDLDAEVDRATLDQLISGADVVLDNFRTGTLERRGMGRDLMLSRHPRLIWCTVFGFEPTSDRPGYDFVVQAESGWMSVTGEPDGEPMKSGVALADVIAGKDATIAILAALIAQGEASGPLSSADRKLDVSLSHSAVAALVNVAQNVLVSGQDAQRWGNAHPNLVPYQLFRTADRDIVVAVGNDAQWRAACEALGLGLLAADEALRTNSGRLRHRETIVRAFATCLLRRDAEFWLGVLGAAGVPCGVVKSVREALASVAASPRTGIPPSAPGLIRRPPPRLDEHGPLIRSHGWDAFRLLAG
jgi:glutaryl-CoA transferase